MLPDHLTFLSEAAGALLTADEPRTYLAGLYKRVSDLLGLEVYVHYMLSEDGTQLHLAASQGVPDQDRPRLQRLALGEAVCGLAAQRRERIVVSDVQHETHDRTVFIRMLGMTAYVCHPLIARGKLLGTLSFGSRRETAFREDALALLEIVSHYIAAALERKQSEEFLTAFDHRRRLYETALSNTPDLVYVFDLDHRFIYANDALLRMWGRTWENAIGKTCLDLGYEAWHAAMHDGEIEQVIATRQPVKGQVPFTGVQGRRTYEYIFVPVLGQNGEVEAVAGTSRDITDRKQAEDALTALTAELEKRVADRTQALWRSRDRLRSLTAELTVTEERERRRIAEELHDHLAQLLVVSRMKLSHVIRQTATGSFSGLLHDIDHVIDQALKYTRSLVVQLTPPVLHELGFQPALQWLASWMDQHGLRVSLRLSPQPLLLSDDQAILLYQSVRELLFNVLKHAGTDRASISVAEEQHKHLRVSVSDDGRGFDVNQAEQTEPGHFGLFSIKERIESLNGKVEITSTPGKGSCVTLIVPYASVDVQLEPSLNMMTNAEPSQRLRVLLVDDHAMVREGLRSILESYPDLEVVGEAGDGMEAVKLARTRQPDVVVMDINMPRMDGIAATRQIKHDRPSTAVIGISVQESTQVEEAMLSAGATAFLTKDRAAGHLYDAILQGR